MRVQSVPQKQQQPQQELAESEPAGSVALEAAPAAPAAATAAVNVVKVVDEALEEGAGAGAAPDLASCPIESQIAAATQEGRAHGAANAEPTTAAAAVPTQVATQLKTEQEIATAAAAADVEAAAPRTAAAGAAPSAPSAPKTESPKISPASPLSTAAASASASALESASAAAQQATMVQQYKAQIDRLEKENARIPGLEKEVATLKEDNSRLKAAAVKESHGNGGSAPSHAEEFLDDQVRPQAHAQAQAQAHAAAARQQELERQEVADKAAAAAAAAAATQTSSPQGLKYFFVTHDFKPQYTDEMRANAGDVVSLESNAKSEEWCICRLVLLGPKERARLLTTVDSSGRTVPHEGLIPRNHLKAAPDTFEIAVPDEGTFTYEIRGSALVRIPSESSSSPVTAKKSGSNKRPLPSSGSPSGKGTYKGSLAKENGNNGSDYGPESRKRARNESYSGGVPPAGQGAAAATAVAAAYPTGRSGRASNKATSSFVSWVGRCLKVVEVLKDRKCAEYFKHEPMLQGYNEVVPKEDARWLNLIAAKLKATPAPLAAGQKIPAEHVLEIAAEKVAAATARLPPGVGVYLDEDSFTEDMNMLFQNCFRFNPQGTPGYKAGVVLRKSYDTTMAGEIKKAEKQNERALRDQNEPKLESHGFAEAEGLLAVRWNKAKYSLGYREAEYFLKPDKCEDDGLWLSAAEVHARGKRELEEFNLCMTATKVPNDDYTGCLLHGWVDDREFCKAFGGTCNRFGGDMLACRNFDSCSFVAHRECLGEDYPDSLFTEALRRSNKYEWECPGCKHCTKCHQKGDDDNFLICDSCDRGMCMMPCANLSQVPAGDWYCPKCPGGKPSRAGASAGAGAGAVNRLL